MIILSIVIVLGLVATVIFFTYGPERSLQAMFGEADLGTVEIKTVKRRRSGNDALVCPQDRCSGKIDIISPTYSIPATHIRDRLREALQKEERLAQVHINDAALRERYVQTSPNMRFPDTIQVEFIELPDKQSTITIYTRSKLGRKDFGSNINRVNRWLGYLKQYELQDS